MEQSATTFGISSSNPLFAKADQLVKQVYIVTVSFPKHELYGMTSQIRRASLSVILNIVEGFARGGKNEFRRFLIIAFGSLKETKYLLSFAQQQNYLSQEMFQVTMNIAEEVARILWSVIHKKK
jgi:four helix bundle protein